jgi:hypothetical protein
LPLTRHLESVDAAHPNTLALLAGPLVLMRILEDSAAASPLTRANLLAAQRDGDGQHEWRASTDAGPVILKPFLDIDAENYSVYQEVVPS